MKQHAQATFRELIMHKIRLSTKTLLGKTRLPAELDVIFMLTKPQLNISPENSSFYVALAFTWVY
jgi:hypothetical protein